MWCNAVLLCCALLFSSVQVQAADHYLVTKSKKVNMRVGPGKQYQVKWVYIRQHTPIKVIAVVGPWVKAEDQEGAVGWIMVDLLTKNNYVTAKLDGTAVLRNKTANSPVTFTVDTGVAMKLHKCELHMCRLSIQGFTGWTAKSGLWGVNE